MEKELVGVAEAEFLIFLRVNWYELPAEAPEGNMSVMLIFLSAVVRDTVREGIEVGDNSEAARVPDSAEMSVG
jgi:hypothetical protein